MPTSYMYLLLDKFTHMQGKTEDLTGTSINTLTFLSFHLIFFLIIFSQEGGSVAVESIKVYSIIIIHPIIAVKS